MPTTPRRRTRCRSDEVPDPCYASAAPYSAHRRRSRPTPARLRIEQRGDDDREWPSIPSTPTNDVITGVERGDVESPGVRAVPLGIDERQVHTTCRASRGATRRATLRCRARARTDGEVAVRERSSVSPWAPMCRGSCRSQITAPRARQVSLQPSPGMCCHRRRDRWAEITVAARGDPRVVGVSSSSRSRHRRGRRGCRRVGRRSGRRRGSRATARHPSSCPAG